MNNKSSFLKVWLNTTLLKNLRKEKLYSNNRYPLGLRRITSVLRAEGGFEEVDELFYPGERSRALKRRAEYPYPDGTGRPSLSSDDITVKSLFKKPEDTIGDRDAWERYAKGIYIGTITTVRRGFLDIHYRTQDGKTFAHSGGPLGADIGYMVTPLPVYRICLPKLLTKARELSKIR